MAKTAKKTTKKAAATVNSKEKTVNDRERMGNVSYKLLKKIPAEGISPQLKTILETIEENGGEVTRPKLMAQLEKKMPEVAQPVQKIFSFYKKDMVGKGLVREIKADRPAA